MNVVKLNTISLNTSPLNAIGEVKMGGANGGGGLDAIGVFIYDIDGKLTAPEDWNSANNNKVVGVYVGNDVHRFIISHKEPTSVSKWGGVDKLINKIPSLDKIEAIKDYNGKTNTLAIIEELRGYTDSAGNIGSPACEACAKYVFPNGKNGYLGSAGEWQMCIDNLTVIIDALEKCGGDTFPKGSCWTSTQGVIAVSSQIISWYYSNSIKSIIEYGRDGNGFTRAFCQP